MILSGFVVHLGRVTDSRRVLPIEVILRAPAMLRNIRTTPQRESTPSIQSGSHDSKTGVVGDTPMFIETWSGLQKLTDELKQQSGY